MNIARSLSLFALPVLLIACAGSEDGGKRPETDAPAKQEAAAPETKMDPARDAAKTPEAPAEAGPTTSITFAENAHDFGTITDGDVVTHIFKFTNTGDEPPDPEPLQGILRLHRSPMPEGAHRARCRG